MAEQKEPVKKKQLKVFLTAEEHAVVTLAANSKETRILDYMKTAVMQHAKKDAAAMMKRIQNTEFIDSDLTELSSICAWNSSIRERKKHVSRNS